MVNRALLGLSIMLTTVLHLSCKSTSSTGNQSAVMDAAASNQISDPPNCSFSGGKDPFEPMTSFTYQDKDPTTGRKSDFTRCIDTRKARPVQQLDQNTASNYNITLADNSITIANLYHQGHFYIATIPLDVATVIFGVEHFPAPVPAAHGFLRVDFNQPVTLVPQVPGDTAGPFTTTRLVFSMEALGEVGWSYDLFKGLNNRFRSVWRVETLSEAYSSYILTEKYKVEQFQLSFDNYPEERAEIVRVWINRSQQNGLDHWYNTVSSSCGLEAFNALETARENMHQGELSLQKCLMDVDKKIATPGEIDPPLAKQALITHKFYKNDLPELVNDPLINTLQNELNNTANN